MAIRFGLPKCWPWQGKAQHKSGDEDEDGWDSGSEEDESDDSSWGSSSEEEEEEEEKGTGGRKARLPSGEGALGREFSLEFIDWLEQVRKVSPDVARQYCSCMDRLVTWTFASTNRTMPKLRNKADGQTFVPDFGTAVTKHAKGKSCWGRAPFNRFKEFVGTTTQLARPGTLAMTEEFRDNFADWLERVPKVKSKSARPFSACVDKLMEVVVGKRCEALWESMERRWQMRPGKETRTTSRPGIISKPTCMGRLSRARLRPRKHDPARWR